MKVFSHRGFHRDVPENTLAAFEAAIALGVDGIETDVRVTREGELILFHNPHTPKGLEIASLTRKEISQSVGYDVPKLEEAIALTQHLNLDFCWNVELKARTSTNLISPALERVKPKTQILVTSFWHDAIATLVQSGLETTTQYGLLWASHPHDFNQTQWFDSYENLTTLVFYQERLSPQLVAQCHQKGKQCFAYGDRTAAERSKLSNWLIDGLITDAPQHVQQSISITQEYS